MNGSNPELYMDRETEHPAIFISLSPTLPQIQTAAEWLADHSYPKPDLKIALNLVLQGRIIPQDAGERVAIAYAPSTPDEISSSTIRGVVIASPGNANVSLVGGDRATIEFRDNRRHLDSLPLFSPVANSAQL